MPNKYQALQGDQHSSPPQEKNNKKLLLQFSSVMSVHLMDQWPEEKPNMAAEDPELYQHLSVFVKSSPVANIHCVIDIKFHGLESNDFKWNIYYEPKEKCNE